MSRIVAGIVHYNEERNFTESLARIISQVDRVFIVDNNSEELFKANLIRTASVHGEKIEIIWSATNLGCSGGHNLILEKLSFSEDQWLVIFNLDSLPAENMVLKLRERYVALENAGTKVGGVGPFYYDPVQPRPSPDYELIEVPSLITSGHLMSTRIFEQGYTFNPQFFVDYVDHEFCLRLSKNGFRFFIESSAEMVHTLGNMNRHNILSLTFYSFNYSEFRLFGQFKGRFMLYKSYLGSHPKWTFDDCLASLKYTGKILLIETRKWSKLKAIFSGILSGVNEEYRLNGKSL